MKYKFSFVILTEANQVVVKSDGPAFVIMLGREPVGNDIDGRVYRWPCLRRVLQASEAAEGWPPYLSSTYLDGLPPGQHSKAARPVQSTEAIRERVQGQDLLRVLVHLRSANFRH